jgi:hypothetical protein
MALEFSLSKKLQGAPILCADFIRKTQMVLDLAKARISFGFAPEKYVYFCKGKGGSLCLQTQPLSSKLPKVQCGKMSVSQKAQLECLISHYSEVLTERLGLTHLMEYEIQLLDKTPVCSAPYRLSPPKMQYFKVHVNKLLRDGVIEHSSSHYSSPMFLVPKAGGEYRAVVDFRALNKRIAI